MTAQPKPTAKPAPRRPRPAPVTLAAVCACGWRSPSLVCARCERDLVEVALPRACPRCGGATGVEVAT